MRWKINRAWRVVLIVLVVLVGVRLVLPFIVTRYVNRVLSDIDGYRGTIEDVDLHLLRGGYSIHNINLITNGGNQQMPFVTIPVTDIGIEWSALFKGALVGELTFENPVLNFIGSKRDTIPSGENPPGGEVHAGQHTDWTAPMKKLMPFDINRVRIKNGKITYQDFTTQPAVNIALNSVQLDAINLDNATDTPEKLPSRIYLQALSIGNGQLNLAMKANLLKEIPDVDFDLKFENIDLHALNNFFKAYANVDVSEGNFNLYSEVAVSNGHITGYVKPMFQNLKVIGNNEKKPPAELLWETIIARLTEAFEDEKKDQFGTSVPLQGEIAEVNSPFLPSLWNTFSIAFVEAFSQKNKNTVSIASVTDESQSVKEESKSKKEIRKERRKEKRKARKERKEKLENEKADRKGAKDNS